MDANERLAAVQTRIRDAMRAQNIDPQTGAPYTDADIDAIARAGMHGAEAGAALRNFINTLDTSGLPDVPNVIPADQIDPVLPNSDRTVVSIHLLTSLLEEVRAKLEQANRDRLTQNRQDIVKEIKVAYETGGLSRSIPIGRLTYSKGGLAELQRAMDAERIERLRMQHGDEWLNEARQLSETRGIPFEQAITYLQIRDAIDSVLPNIEHVMNAFAQFAKALGERMPEGINDGINNAPCNRHERRASKYIEEKRLRDKDRSWLTRRNYRNRR